MGATSILTEGATWAPLGEMPVIEAADQRFGLDIISALSP